MLGARARDEKTTQKISDYDTTMDLYVVNIDKIKIIYGGPSTRILMNITL